MDPPSLGLNSKAMVGYVPICLTIVAITITIFIASRQNYPKMFKRNRLPPGPKGLPFLGSVLWYLSARRDPRKFTEFWQTVSSYGEMTTLRMGTRTWVFLNSPRIVKELINKRASLTSERPTLPVSSGLVSRNNRTVLKKTAQWQEGRKLMHHLLSGTALKTYAYTIEDESVRLLKNCLRNPEQWFRHHYDYPYAVIHRIVVGERPMQSTKQLDDFRRITVEFISSICASVFDFWPDLGMLQPHRRYWRKMGERHNEVLKAWWEPVWKDMSSDYTAPTPPSFVRNVLLHSNSTFSRNNEEAMYLATSIVAAGSDNVRRAQNTLMMAALCHPDIIKKARKQIDSLCGSPTPLRLPSLADMESLPYISAIIKEALRWRPVVPLIPPHHSTEPIDFQGYTFPAGTDFIINSMAVASSVDQPDEFRPERWEKTEPSITADLWAFGGGRRVCVGYKIAHQELFLALARMLYCFDITCDGPFDSGKLNHHHVTEAPFPLRIVPRGEAHARLIEGLAVSG